MKKKVIFMKKVLAIFLAAALAGSILTACGGSGSSSSGSDTSGEVETTPEAETGSEDAQDDGSEEKGPEDSAVAEESGAEADEEDAFDDGAEDDEDLDAFIDDDEEWMDEAESSYEGHWVADRISLYIVNFVGVPSAVVYWPSSAAEVTRWEYSDLFFDEEADKLNTLENGVKTNILYNEDGNIESSEVEFEDGTAAFALTEDGHLVWTDYKAASGENEITLEKVGTDLPVPDAAAFAEEYFRMVGSAQADAAADTALEVMSFAVRNSLWGVDVPALRASMLEGWESMTEEERNAFDANFTEIVDLIDAACMNWDDAKTAFEDSGNAAKMEALVSDPLNRQCWEVLVSHTFTMGNSDGD